MNIEHKGYHVELTEKDVGIWMTALRMAARSNVKMYPWSSDPFYVMHEALVKATGFGYDDHKSLGAELSGKAPKMI